MVLGAIHAHSRRVYLAASLLLGVGAGLATVVAPAVVDRWLLIALSGISSQRASHSYFIAGQQLALEARMFGIFVGFGSTLLVAWAGGGWRRTELPRGPLLASLVAGVIALGLDGLNATLFDRALPHLYTPRNDLRLISGLWGGFALAALSGPVISSVFWSRSVTVREPFFARWRELAAPLLVVSAIAYAVLSANAAAAWLSIIAFFCVLASFEIVNSYVCVLLWQGPLQATRWDELRWAAVGGLILTIVELGGMAVIRQWAESTLGLTWGL